MGCYLDRRIIRRRIVRRLLDRFLYTYFHRAERQERRRVARNKEDVAYFHYDSEKESKAAVRTLYFRRFFNVNLVIFRHGNDIPAPGTLKYRIGDYAQNKSP